MRYLRPARLDDVIEVSVRLLAGGRTSMAFAQQARRGAELLCEAEIRIGWVHPDDMGELRPRRIPAQVLDALPAPAWTTS